LVIGLATSSCQLDLCPFHSQAATLGKSFRLVPLFTKQYTLIPADGGDAVKLGR